jgi:hypothetical protein
MRFNRRCLLSFVVWLLAVGLSALVAASDAFGQSLRVKITTNELLHYGVSYCIGDETSIAVGEVNVMLGLSCVS